MSFHATAASIGPRVTQWLIGQLADSSYLNSIDDAINADPQAVQVSTITLTAETSATAYTVTINGVDITYTSDASATYAEVAAGLVAAIDADPIVGGAVTAAITTPSTVITVTGRTAGEAFTLTDADSKITCALVTAAADAAAVPFGRLVVGTPDGYSDGTKLCALAAAGKLTAQVDSWAITYENTIQLIAEITVDGVTYRAVHAMATDLDTSIDAFVVKINGVMAGLPAATVIATANAASATALVLTSEVAGKPFTSSITLGVSATVAAPVLTQTAPVTSDINRAALGISLHTYDESETTVGSGVVVYPANAGVKFARTGRVAVACAEVVTPGLPVYVELGVTADNGKFFVASSATRVRLNCATWERNERSSASDDVAVLRIAAA